MKKILTRVPLVGADGGITWVRVKDRQKFWDLIRPFRLHWVDDYHDKYHDAYLADNPLPSDCEVTTYGSFQTHDGFNDLRLMIEEAEWLTGEKNYLWPGVTFLDYLISEYTLPSWQGLCGGKFLRNLVDWQMHRLFQPSESTWLSAISRAEKDPILNMPIAEWHRQLLDVIYPDSFGSTETWT